MAEPLSLIGKDKFWKGAFAVTGIMSTLVIYGLLQEKIMRVPYGSNKEFFKYSLFLVFCNRIMTSAISAVTLLASKKALDPVAPVYKYCVISVSNILTTTCQYEALKYVSFPVQTLAKCAKMVPVMEKVDDLRKKKQKKKKQMEEENVNEVISEVRNPSDKDIDSEEDDFWMPLLGERWDFDDGGDRWGSGSESGPKTEDASEPGLGHSSSGWFGCSFCFWTGRSCCPCHWEWFGIIFY